MSNRYSTLKDSILKEISIISGYAVEDLELDMYLEADLGFDSIKMVNLMGQVFKLLPNEEIEQFTEKNPVNQLMLLETIGEIVDVFDNWTHSKNSQGDLSISHDEASTQHALTDNNTAGNHTTANAPISITHSQYTFLASYYSVGTISLCSYVEVCGEIDRRALTMAWQSLVDSYPILQGEFSYTADAASFKDYSFHVAKSTVVPEIQVNSIVELSEQEKQSYIDNRVREIINTKLDIFKWPLHNIEVIRTHLHTSLILLSNSHLISDGLGNQQILRELLERYQWIQEGKDLHSFKKINLIDYNQSVEALNHWNDEKEQQKLKEYVSNQGKEKYCFNFGKSTLQGKNRADVKSISYSLGQEDTAKLYQRAKEYKVSLFTLLVSCYLKTIYEEQAQDKIIINLPTGGRVYPNADLSNMIGCFAQNLSLTFASVQNKDFFDYVQLVNEEIHSAILNGFDRVQTNQMVTEVTEKNILENGAMSPLVALFINASLKSNLYLSFVGDTHFHKTYGNLSLTDYWAFTSTNVNAIDNLVELFDGKLRISSNYDSNNFDTEEINHLMHRYINNLSSIPAYENKPIHHQNRAIDLSTKEYVLNLLQDVTSRVFQEDALDKDLEHEFGIDSLERIRIITKIAKDHKAVDKNLLFQCRTIRNLIDTLHDKPLHPIDSIRIHSNDNLQIPYVKIMQQCKETPNDVAILHNGIELKYKDLDALSNKIGHFLRENGVQRNSLVGIFTLPGPLMTLGMLGILKAGGAYVPIDPQYPLNRIQYILEHGKIKFLLTEHGLKETLFDLIQENRDLDMVAFLDEGEMKRGGFGFLQVLKSTLDTYSPEDLSIVNEPEDLMCVIYTSGSTGNPKGVMLNHEGYMNRLVWHQKMFPVGKNDRVAQKTSCCFDISVWEIFWPLMYGATQCPVKKEVVQNPWALAQWMMDTKINVMHFVPSMFGEFVNALEYEEYDFKDLRWLLFSGEALPMKFIQKWMDAHGDRVSLANLYGPTEASIDVSYHIITERPGSRGENSIPIGKAIDNVILLNLDENMNPVPQGEMGELWLGGIQLSMGYFNDKEKTEAAFKENPFQKLDTAYLYKTGDLVIDIGDGVFEYHGRKDNQIKIRGFRVELGEIENVIYKNMNVEEVAVVDVDFSEENKKIVACIGGTETSLQEIKEAVSSHLPQYMIPHMVRVFKSLPRTSNGKTDRKQLKHMILNNIEDKALHKTENMAEMLPNENQILVQKEKEDALYPLMPAQKWLLHYFEYPYRWTGYSRFIYKEKMDQNTFDLALNKLAEKHEALRVEMVNKNHTWMQKIHESMDVRADFLDASHFDKNQVEDLIQQNISKEIKELSVNSFPLWKVMVVKLPNGHFDISVIGHHLISDVLTNQILFRDMWTIYAKLLMGEPMDAKAKPTPYQKYLEEITNIRAKQRDSVLSYWLEQFPSEDKKFLLPKDIDHVLNTEESARTCMFELDTEGTSILLGKAKKYYQCNVYPILLAALYKMLSIRYSRDEVIVAHRVNGRDTGVNTHFETAGDFAVNFPMAINGISKRDNKSLVSHIGERYESIPLKGAGYDLISEQLPAYMYPDNKLTSIRANYLGNREEQKFNTLEFKKEHRDKRFSVPEQKRISEIEIFLYIEQRTLKVEIEYSKNHYKEETIAALGEEYIAQLKELLRECAAQASVAVSDEDTVVVITGGGRGIGKEIAKTLANKTSILVLLSRNEKELSSVSKELQGDCKDVLFCKADIKELSEVQQVVDTILNKYGKIDVLVNNAGVTEMCSLVDSKPESWSNIIHTNLIGTYNMCYSIVPHMIKRKAGKIVNIGSDSSFVGYPLMTAYAASKHAVLGFTKALSEELKIHNIQVNAVCPALVDTDMAPPTFRAKAISPKKVANVVKYLASAESAGITGEAIKVYGKQDMYWFGSDQMMLLQSFITKKENKAK